MAFVGPVYVANIESITENVTKLSSNKGWWSSHVNRDLHYSWLNGQMHFRNKLCLLHNV